MVQEACKLLKIVLQARAPYDTGNLALNSIRVVDGCKVVIGGEIADYAVFTNEPWSSGKNPNEGWVERAIEEATPFISATLSGTATEKDVAETLEKYKGIIRKRQAIRRAEILEKKAEIYA